MGLVIPPTDPRQIERALDDSLLRFVDNTIIVNPRFFKKVYEGRGFTASHRFTGIASGSFIDMYFENPSNSGRTVYIVAIEVTALAQCYIDVYRNNTISSPGTPITPLNLNLGSSNTSVAHVEYGGSYSYGTLAKDTLCPGGSKKEAIGGHAEIGESAVIPPGYNFLVHVTNASASSTDIAIEILWWEE